MGLLVDALPASVAAWLPIVAAVVVVLVTVVVGVAGRHVYGAIKSKRAPDYDVEGMYRQVGGGYGLFPTLADAASVTLSVIVPAYNEAERITPMMKDMLGHLEAVAKADASFSWEVLVVDDGSKDTTSAYVWDTYVSKYGTDRFRLLTLFKNNGKGGAVRKGMVRARGAYLLMADADGATLASDASRLLAAVKGIERDGLGIAIGSRAHMEEAEGDAKAKRTFLRKVLMWGFHTLIDVMIGSSQIKDTQCGFKLFTRAAARALFPVQHIDRWAFDVELIFLAARQHIPMVVRFWRLPFASCVFPFPPVILAALLPTRPACLPPVGACRRCR